jgi:hypothetical protein
MPRRELEGTTVRVQALSINQIKLNGRNSRTHSGKQIRQIANSIMAFGFTRPGESAGHRAGRTFAGETARACDCRQQDCGERGLES